MDIEEVKEYRNDGSLIYECTIRNLSKSEERFFDRRVGESGKSFIRINYATKYREDGSIEWRLIYNDKGEVVGTHRGVLINKVFS